MALRLMPHTIVAYGLSDMGLIRQNNEDVWASVLEKRLFILADGMGGHQAGEVAAKEAVQYFLSRFQSAVPKSDTPQDIQEMIRAIIRDTNTFIFRLGQTHELLRGMGTTFCCLYFLEDFALYAHVGDSRIYRVRDGQVMQLTHDHSLLRELIDLGQIREQQIDEFLYKNIITRAIGTESNVEPTVEVTPLQIGDLYLLCSDGLSDLLSVEEIQTVLVASLTIEEKVRSLIAEAKQRGGHDNITVVIVEIRKAHESISR